MDMTCVMSGSVGVCLEFGVEAQLITHTNLDDTNIIYNIHGPSMDLHGYPCRHVDCRLDCVWDPKPRTHPKALQRGTLNTKNVTCFDMCLVDPGRSRDHC